jgi:Zn-dependent protease with chaperone function
MSQTYAEIKREQAEHIAAIKRNEAELEKDPVRYSVRLKRFALVGYFLYACMIALAIISAILVFYIVKFIGINKLSLYLVLFAGFFLFSTLASLIVKNDPGASSVLLKRDDAPLLWKTVDDITAKIKAPRVDEIRVDAEFNASAAQWPRFGLLGKVRNILTIGSPLMMSLNTQELKGVIGHEMGHFAGDHGKKTGFVYRSAMIFQNLYNNMNGESGSGGFMLRRIVNWFFPRLEQLAMPLSRKNEFEADRAEVLISGTDSFASAFYKMNTAGTWFYKNLYEEVLRRKPENPLEWLEHRLSSPVPQLIYKESIEKAIQSQTEPGDTHPSMTERLQAQGYQPPTSDHVDQLMEKHNVAEANTSYRELLNPSAIAKVEQVQGKYFEDLSTVLLERGVLSPLHEDINYDEISTPSNEPVVATWKPKEGLTLLQQFNLVQQEGKSLSNSQYFANLTAYCDSAKQDRFLRFCIASELDMSQADKVIELLDAEVINDSALGAQALGILTTVYDSRDIADKAAWYHELLISRQQEIQKFASRISTSGPGILTSPKLSTAHLEKIQGIINSVPDISSAFLCEETFKFTGSNMVSGTVLYFDPLPPKKAKWRWAGVSDKAVPLQNHLREIVPGAIFLMPLVDSKKHVLKKLLKNSEVHVLRAPTQQ